MNLTPPLDPTDLEQCLTLFRLSRMLYAIITLNLPSLLVSGPQSAPDLARMTDTHVSTLTSLLDTLACWGVFARDEQNRYTLAAFSERLIPGSSNPANRALLLGWAGFPGAYEAFGDLLHTLRTGQSAFYARYGTDFHGYLSTHPEMRALYAQAMEATTEGFRRSTQAYDFSHARRLIDVGGGQGAFALEILDHYPKLRAICFDLPEVISQSRALEHPAGDRLEFVSGDALAWVPSGGDLYITSTVLRCFDDARCLKLLQNIRAAMTERNARLAAFEMVVPEQRDHLARCTADLVARVMYGGQDRTEREFKALFTQAGLRYIRTVPTAGDVSVLEAVPE